MIKFERLKVLVKGINPSLEIHQIDFSKIIFGERVKLKCHQCKRYNVNWTCPPKIPEVNYLKVLQEYDNMAVIIKRWDIKEKDDLDTIRISSTNELHRSMLELEKCLWMRNEVMTLSFIGGSCKLCRNGCGEERCTNPTMARIPFEAIGVDVIATMKNIGVSVSFPIIKQLKRIGLFLW